MAISIAALGVALWQWIELRRLKRDLPVRIAAALDTRDRLASLK